MALTAEKLTEVIINEIGDGIRPYSSVLTSVIAASRITEHIRGQQAYGKLTKADSSPVTIADLASQMAVVEGIRKAFPNELIIAEEDSTSLQSESIRAELHAITTLFNIHFDEFKDLGEISSERTIFWTIDPIDGTKGFLRNGQYAVCVARVEEKTVTHSFVSCPNLPCSIDKSIGTLFVAIRNEGVYEVSLSSGEVIRLKSRKDALLHSVMAESVESGHTSHHLSASLRSALGLHAQPLQLDSQCKYGILARGDASLYLRKPKEGYREKIWDHAPGWLLVTEAGGQVTDFNGNPIVFDTSSTLSLKRGIVASLYSPEDHQNLLDYLKNT